MRECAQQSHGAMNLDQTVSRALENASTAFQNGQTAESHEQQGAASSTFNISPGTEIQATSATSHLSTESVLDPSFQSGLENQHEWMGQPNTTSSTFSYGSGAEMQETFAASHASTYLATDPSFTSGLQNQPEWTEENQPERMWENYIYDL
jgi:hypothetical protein